MYGDSCSSSSGHSGPGGETIRSIIITFGLAVCQGCGSNNHYWTLDCTPPPPTQLPSLTQHVPSGCPSHTTSIPHTTRTFWLLLPHNFHPSHNTYLLVAPPTQLPSLTQHVPSGCPSHTTSIPHTTRTFWLLLPHNFHPSHNTYLLVAPPTQLPSLTQHVPSGCSSHTTSIPHTTRTFWLPSMVPWSSSTCPSISFLCRVCSFFAFVSPSKLCCSASS